MTPFARLIAQLRQEHGESLGSFARRLEIDRSHLSRLEAGTRGPSLDLIARMRTALGLPPEAHLVIVCAYAGYHPPMELVRFIALLDSPMKGKQARRLLRAMIYALEED